MTLYIRKHKVLKEWFGRYQPVKVTSELWDEFVRHRLETGRLSAWNSIRPANRADHAGPRATGHEAGARIGGGEEAHPGGVEATKFRPRSENRPQTRGAFSEAELERVIQAIQREVRTERHAADPLEQADVPALAHGHAAVRHLRINDALLLRWRDVRRAADLDGQPVALLDCRGKGKERTCVTNRACLGLADGAQAGRGAPHRPGRPRVRRSNW